MLRQLLALWLCLATGYATAQSLTTVSQVDLTRYAGQWYEIARLPNVFQRKCVANVMATYTLREDGDIDVLNQCDNKDGKTQTAQGLARSTNPPENSRLEVSFFNVLGIRPFWGDYWVIALEDDYRYVVVGEPDRDYVWLLSRTPTLPDDTVALAKSILEREGFAVEQLIYTPQKPRD
ncbi:lipocalin family protein [Kistimonas asteriae]|uniref:lipocalin family protein n=1 Tax=Kistimonas asteriae TaxID=517724 RepID=UPI001BA5AC30|nr:lipocalin family protein [Kistimonas asteriae]